jgi:hypothetical protein
MMRRYIAVIQARDPKLHDEDFLVKFCETALTLKNPDKLSRWVGNIQGTLIDRKILNTQFERDISRALYKPIYNQLGYDSSTVNVE